MTAILVRRSMFTFLLIAAAVSAATVALPQIQVPLSEHALEKHGHDAEIAQQCLSGKEGFLFVNPATQHIAIVCWLEDRWGIVILCALTFTVITAFVCAKLKTKEKMTEYMHRQGYQDGHD